MKHHNEHHRGHRDGNNLHAKENPSGDGHEAGSKMLHKYHTDGMCENEDSGHYKELMKGQPKHVNPYK